MQPRDVYKLLYQGVRGPEHIIASAAAFTDRLVEEWEALDLPGNDPLWESIRPDGSLLRLNLRPFKAEGGRLDRLITACLETSCRTWGTQADLQQAWESFTEGGRERPLSGLALEDVKSFTSWLEANGFPPVHHSERYRVLYRPAYCLITASFKLCGIMEIKN